uniref:Uncharacterized protein n=1 Tax=Anguilla anguilla TaxID=7936 RepID=A0A0E9R1P9_ANGAN
MLQRCRSSVDYLFSGGLMLGACRCRRFSSSNLRCRVLECCKGSPFCSSSRCKSLV